MKGNAVVRLLRAILLCALVFAAGIASATALGQGVDSEEDARLRALGLCGDVPCMLDVIPGETAWRDVENSLRTRPRTVFQPRMIALRMQPNSMLELYPSVDNQSVGRIYLLLLDAPVSAGWIVQRYGQPCGVSIYYGAGLVTLRYPRLLANVAVQDGWLRADSPVTSVRLADPHFVFESQPDPCVDNITSRQMLNSVWMGFASFAFYEGHQE
jgi:hypothetical protein